jgi:hypothetical protein
MLLKEPEAYVPDKGHSLTPEEFVQAVRETTHVSKIKSRTCKREDTNDCYRLGRR